MNSYTLAKTFAIIFGSTTVIIFGLLYTGVFVGMVGGIDAAMVIFGANSFFLVVSFVWYSIEKGRKKGAAQQKLSLLEAYGERNKAQSEMLRMSGYVPDKKNRSSDSRKDV